MGPPTDVAVGALLTTLGTGMVLSIAAVFIVHKMVDKDLSIPAGIGAMFVMILCMILCVKPPHPVVPAVVLISVVTLLAFFPFAEQKLEEFELRKIDAERLARAFGIVEARPDNFAAKLELAKWIHEHGFAAHAIYLAESTLSQLSTEKDDVKNRSMRDLFSREEGMLRRWKTEPPGQQTYKCMSCGALNRPEDLFCHGCRRPYMLDIVRSQEVTSRVWAKLVLAWAALALFIPGVVAIAMVLDGVLRISAFVAALAVVAVFVSWLFRPPKHAPVMYGE
ncbi:MAG TPA: hypothetical protein VMI31_03745 [Fimbriimonadaceae bacterium]|nr:hypothetical protein [Fimbriimonadaceae bacterium]